MKITVLQWGESVDDAAPIYPGGRKDSGVGECFRLAVGDSRGTFWIPHGDVGLDRCAICLGGSIVLVTRRGLAVVCDVSKGVSSMFPMYPVTGVRTDDRRLLLWSFTELAVLSAGFILRSERLVDDSLEIRDVSPDGRIKATGWSNGEAVSLELNEADLRLREALPGWRAGP